MASKKSKRRGKKKVRPIQALPVIRANSAGIDLGSEEHWVCGPARGDNKVNVQQFGTTTPQLSELADTAALQRLERRGLIALREAMPSARPVTNPGGEPARSWKDLAICL